MDITIKNLFKKHFSKEPQFFSEANGRVNLIGEHTDYSGGYVLPTLIAKKTMVAISLRDDNKIRGVSDIFGESECTIQSSPDGTWLDFIRGAINYVNKEGADIRGVNLTVSSDIPIEAGLSSSAALEISVLRALIKSTNLNINSTDLAILGQKIEHNFVGTQCGVMDQIVCSKSKFGKILFLDCEKLITKTFKSFSEYSFLIIHSGDTRKLPLEKYNNRKKEIEKVMKLLNVSSLKNITINQVNQIENPILRKRTHHVVSENNRVLQAYKCFETNNPKKFGKLMFESHTSMSKDYEISSNKLDNIVNEAKNSGALGARLTGAGFGGCVVVLCEPKSEELITKSITTKCTNSHLITKICPL